MSALLRWVVPFGVWPQHRHEWFWRVVRDRATPGLWWVTADCACKDVMWARAVTSGEELNKHLRLSFTAGSLSPLAYFTAPTSADLS